MAINTRFYWIKLKQSLMTSKAVDFLMSQKDGANYVVLYQCLCLSTINQNGELADRIGEIIIPFDEGKIQRETKWFTIDTIRVAMNLYKQLGLIYEQDNGLLKIADFQDLIGSETKWAKYKREERENENNQILKIPKSNAERQRQYRAKELCKNNQHIPYIEDYMNNKRYNGNYYLVFKRDEMKCSICGSVEKLCVHHIDGYNEQKPENSNFEKLITLCRSCHRDVHENNIQISKNKLESIGYYDNICNESNESCPTDVQQDIDNRDKNIDNRIKDIKEKDIIEKESEVSPITAFLSKYNIQIDTINGEFGDYDFNALDECFQKSKWLRGYIKCTSELCKLYRKILTGQYEDNSFWSNKNDKDDKYSQHFAYERDYTEEELNALISSVDDIKI